MNVCICMYNYTRIILIKYVCLLFINNLKLQVKIYLDIPGNVQSSFEFDLMTVNSKKLNMGLKCQVVYALSNKLD